MGFQSPDVSWHKYCFAPPLRISRIIVASRVCSACRLVLHQLLPDRKSVQPGRYNELPILSISDFDLFPLLTSVYPVQFLSLLDPFS